MEGRCPARSNHRTRLEDERNACRAPSDITRVNDDHVTNLSPAKDCCLQKVAYLHNGTTNQYAKPHHAKRPKRKKYSYQTRAYSITRTSPCDSANKKNGRDPGKSGSSPGALGRVHYSHMPPVRSVR